MIFFFLYKLKNRNKNSSIGKFSINSEVFKYVAVHSIFNIEILVL